MTEGGRVLRMQLLIGFMCVALVVYFLLLSGRYSTERRRVPEAP